MKPMKRTVLPHKEYKPLDMPMRPAYKKHHKANTSLDNNRTIMPTYIPKKRAKRESSLDWVLEHDPQQTERCIENTIVLKRREECGESGAMQSTYS